MSRTRRPAPAVIGYLRVSTDEQASSGAGLDAQRAAIEDYAARHGITVTAWRIDAGVSGAVAPADRPQLGAALATLDEAGGALLVAKPDRIARKAADLLALRDLAESRGWALTAVDGSLDSSTPAGRAMAGMLAVFAELERDMIRARTREALAARKAAGVRLGRPVTLPEPVRARIGAQRAAGVTLQAIADGLVADGVPTARGGSVWRPSQVAAVLRSLEADAQAQHAAQTHHGGGSA